LSEFQEMKKDLDQLWSLEEARKEHACCVLVLEKRGKNMKKL
jgi:hypothetical protein